jgi:antibiotic biosynthesis monooxygenase (ABM) superfamily enzyme
MTDKSRRITSLVYIVSLILTLVFALTTNILPLVFIFLIIQICSYYWYTLSYIPFGQKCMKKICESLCK